MVVSPFGLLEMEVEGVFRQALELGQPDFGHAPEAFDAVDMNGSFRKLVSRAWGMSRALLKLSGSLVHDYATIFDDSPSPNRAARARRAATSAGIS